MDQGTPKKRKRSPEWTPTVEPITRKSVAGPSKSRTLSSPTKQSKSPLTRKLKASSDSDEDDAVEMMVPSSDVDEDEISSNPTRLNPQGSLFNKYYFSLFS